MESDNRFGEAIRKRRIEMQMTQYEVAQKLDVSQNFVTYLEKGQRKPTNDMIRRIAGVLSLSMDTLYMDAHPDLPEFLRYDKVEKKLFKQLPPALEKLKSDRALRSRHGITDEEVQQLATMRLRGEIKNAEDYVFLLMSIRQVLRYR